MRLSRENIRRNAARLEPALRKGEQFRTIAPDAEVADRAVRGQVRFRQATIEAWTDVGRRDIDWSAPEHAHQEWPAQLNRFMQLAPLAAAYLATGDEGYAGAARDYILDWIRAHPSRPDWSLAPYDNTLNLCIRTLHWFTALPAFLDSPAFDDDAADAMLESLQAQYGYLTAHLSSRMNWRIAQADSLLTNGVRLDGLEGAERWRTLGVHVLNDAYHRQILPDGAHMERNPGYHLWMTAVFEHCWRMARTLPELGLVMQAEPVARMHDYAVAVTRPNGALNAMHDCVGRRTGSEPNAPRERRAEFRREAGLPDELPPTSQLFPHAGQAFLRDAWDEDATYVTFDATAWGLAHCHLSRNAIQLHAGRRSLIVDPGYLSYEASDPFCAHGKSTRAHSTINLNGWNQSETDPRSRFESLPGYDLAVSRYDGGYWTGQHTWGFRPSHGEGVYAWHHRTMLWVRGRGIFVLDQVWHDYGERPVFLESNWQLSEGPVEVDHEGGWARTCHPDSNVLLLFPKRPAGIALHVHEGEKDPIRGWLPAEGGCVPAPQLCQCLDPFPAGWTDLATVLLPFRGERAPEVQAEAESRGGASRLLLRRDDGSSDEIHWTGCLGTALDLRDDFETDASMVHIMRDPAGRPVRALVVDGTFIRPYAPAARPAPQCFTLSF
ncbi:MAG: hypothetical protein GXY85_05835 [Candidatus Brocadiaceae bacterium]|nr:hypothetical protein [Candidatus Brocadiaceae bacterium]